MHLKTPNVSIQGNMTVIRYLKDVIRSILLHIRANIIPRLIWRRRTDRMTSLRYLIAVMFPWMLTFGVFKCIKTLERVLLGLFSQYLMFFIIDNWRGTLSYQIRQLPCRARGARAHNLFSHLPFRMDIIVQGNVLSFPKSIDWCVQYNVTKL